MRVLFGGYENGKYNPHWFSTDPFFCSTSHHLQRSTKNARNRCEIGRFVYIFVYKFRKSLKINVYCGERGRRYQVTILRNSLILNSCTSQNFIFFALLWRRTGARQNAPNHWNSESLLNEFTYFKKSMTAVMPENRVFASEFGSSYCTFPGLHQTVLMPAHGGFFKPWSGVQIIIRIVIPYSYKRSFTSHDVWNPIGEMVL